MKLASQALLGALVLTAAFAAVPEAEAQQLTTFVIYPDGSRSFNFNLGLGANALLFVDVPGDFDAFIHTSTSVGNFFLVTLGPFPGLGFWLDFQGLSGPNLLFNVWTITTTGVPFQFVGQILL